MVGRERVWVTVRPVKPNLEISTTARFNEDETRALKERFGEDDFESEITKAIMDFFIGLCQSKAQYGGKR